MELALPELEEDILHELLDTINESLDDVEIGLENLNADPSRCEVLDDIFRHLHSIKGNYRVCFLGPFSNYVHAIEETFAEIRSGRLKYSPLIKEITLIAIDRLRANMDLLDQNNNLDTSEMEQISHHFLMVATAEANKADQAAKTLLDTIVGIDSTEMPIAVELPDSEPPAPTPIISDELDNDIRYFQSIAFLLEGRNSFWRGRTQRMLGIVTAVIPFLPYKIDRQQFHAALYIHDLGMSFLPDSILHSTEKLTDQQRQELNGHPIIGHHFLKRLEHWNEASQMVLQHHERIDGNGYPNGITGDEICNGAKLLAVADAFTSLTSDRADRSHRRTVLRALMEITTHSGTQFDEATVIAFTEMAKQRYK